MNSVLINGCFDSKTLQTLKQRGVKEFAFDLRPKSLNLVTLKDLNLCLSHCSTEQLYLTFENERVETIFSYLNLLKDRPFTFTLIFRDQRDPYYYQSLNQRFYWMFNPEAAWEEILHLPKLTGLLLPLKYQEFYRSSAKLWSLIDEKNLDVYLHAETFEETLFMNLSQEMKLSLDLSPEVETSYRSVDQEKLSRMKIWSRVHENPSL